MQKFKKLICAALAGCLLVPLASCGTEKADVSDIFDSNEKFPIARLIVSSRKPRPTRQRLGDKA